MKRGCVESMGSCLSNVHHLIIVIIVDFSNWPSPLWIIVVNCAIFVNFLTWLFGGLSKYICY